MQSLDLNLASRPFRNNTLIWAGYALAVVFLGLFTFWNVEAYREHADLLTDLRDKVSKIQSRLTDLELREQRARKSIQKYDLAKLRVQTTKANDVIQWKAFSWTRLFNLLEQVQPYEVKMVSVRPVFHASERRSATDGVPVGAVPVKVHGIAKNLATFLEFERSLLADPHFDRVEPEGNSQLPTGETRFELKFLYFPEQSAGHEEIDIPPVVAGGTPETFRQMEEEYKRKLEAGELDEEAPAETPSPDPPADEPAQGAAGGATTAQEAAGADATRPRPDRTRRSPARGGR